MTGALTRRVVVALGALGCLLLAEGLASAEEAAEDGDRDRARALFFEGVEFSERSEWANAVERFNQALELHPAATIRYNLAASLARLERWVEAAEQLDMVIAEEIPADASAEDRTRAEQLRGRARELLREVEPNTGQLRVSVQGLEDADLSLDGAPVDRAGLDAPIRVAPGRHVITGTVDGQEVARAEETVSGGQVAQLTLVRIPTPAETAAAAGTEPPPVEEPSGGGLATDWRLWTGVGAGVAVVLAVALGLGFGLSGRVEDPVEGNMDPAVLSWP